MSQISKPGGSGSLPVATTYITESDSPAIPSNNELIVVGSSGPDYTVNGIESVGAGGGNVLSIALTNTQNDGNTTVDNTPKVISAFGLPTIPAVLNFEYKISALNTTDSLGAVYLIIAGVRTTGTTAFSLNTADITSIEEGAMSSCVVQFGMFANTVTITATGLAGKIIEWDSQLKYTRVT